LQIAAALYGQNRGQADLAFQGFYMGASSQALDSTTGAAVRFQDFIPNFGLLSGSFEGYGAQNQLQTGENFLQLRGAAWMGYHWTISAGDFHTSGSLIDSPFYNIFTPEIVARGVRVQATDRNTEYTFFAGQETLSAGPRVPYRILAPQTAIGASVVRRFGERLRIGVRFLELSSSAQQIAGNPSLFPAGRDVGQVHLGSVQAIYKPAKRLKLYAELSRALESGVLSSVAGVAWEDKAFTARANYLVEGELYFPLIGYFTGDRRGPFGEVRVRPWRRLEFYGAASQYRNNLANDPGATNMLSSTVSAGVNADLPWKLSANGQLSIIGFWSQSPGAPAVTSDNRLWTGSLSRPLRRQSLQVNWRELTLVTPPLVQRQNSLEIQDTYQLGHFSLGGAARFQQSAGSEQLNSVYLRGSLQGHAGRFSAFANWDYGDDLVNRTVFATNTYDTTVFGIGLKLPRNWNLHAETFRNRLLMQLNPESIFVLGGAGAGVSQNLASLNQWSVYFSVTKQVRWGGGLRGETTGQAAADAVPLIGTVEGVVRTRAMAGAAFAAGIPVTLDGRRTAATGADGRYFFNDVPEGSHEVSLSATELPADFDPGNPASALVTVQPRRTVRADFEVLPLSSIEGAVTGPAGTDLGGIRISLLPGTRDTVTAPDGHFAFYNVREGDLNLEIDKNTLPANARLISEPSLPADVRSGTPVQSATFRIEIVAAQKTIRKVLEKRLDKD